MRYPDLAYQVRGGKLKFDHALAEARARAKALPEPPSPRKVARPPGRCRGYTTSFFFTPLGNRAKREAVSQLVVGHAAAKDDNKRVQIAIEWGRPRDMRLSRGLIRCNPDWTWAEDVG